MENNLKLEIGKDFPVSVGRLYQAWTTEEQLKQWWKPMGSHLDHVQNDLKPGGKVEYHFENSEPSAAFTINGQYEEVAENEKLVYTWNWKLPGEHQVKSDFKLSIGFQKKGGQSRLHVLQENIHDEEAVKLQKEGWEKALNDLYQFLQEG